MSAKLGLLQPTGSKWKWMIATRRKIDHSDSNSFDSTLYVCTQLLLYLGCWQQPCKCRICQGIHLSFARPASTLTSPVTYCDVCIYIPVEIFVTKSEASGPLQNGFWLPFCAKFWPWVLPSCKWTPPGTGILHWKCEFVTLQSRPFCRSLEG